jgi:hypothetical protein
VPGASLRGTTAVSPLTTPRAVFDSFQSHEFQHWMGGQASVSTSPKLGACLFALSGLLHVLPPISVHAILQGWSEHMILSKARPSILS